MRELRTILLRVPPLLAGLVERNLRQRLVLSGVTLTILGQLHDVAELARWRLEAPDLIIAGCYGGFEAGAPLLAFSLDMTQLLGPGPADVTALTPETLAREILKIAGR